MDIAVYISIFLFIVLVVSHFLRSVGKSEQEDKCDKCPHKNNYVSRSDHSHLQMMVMEDTLKRWSQEIDYYRKEISDFHGQAKSLMDENTRLTKELKKWTGKEKVQFT